MKLKLVIIEWVDACGNNDTWVSLDDKEVGFLAPCVSVGWLIKETKKVKTIAHTVSAYDKPGDGILGIENIR